jgi:ABC-type transporter Mla subunit MlaD
MLVPRSFPMRRLTAGAIAAVLSVGALAGCGRDDQPPTRPETAKAQQVIDGVEKPVERLQDALEQARPRFRSSMVEMRAAAERAADRLDDAADDLRTLNAESATEDDRIVRDAEDALDSLAQLATALTARVPSATRIEDLAAEARLAVDDLEALRIRELNADPLVAAVRQDRRRRAARAARRATRASESRSARPNTNANIGGSTFNTGRDAGESTAAAYCRAVPGELRCWTPNDGFTLVLDEAGARRDRASEPGNRGYEPATPQLNADGSWSSYGFSCSPTGRALTCSNTSGHAFTLPRYRGLPSYF